MELYFDFHIHTALSPCSNNDMTPNNIVRMAKIKGLDAIAITDHNSCENVEACIKAGREVGIIVIPGIELQTREDIHIICLFDELDSAEEFQTYVYKHLPDFENKSSFFGEQIIYNENDDIIGYNRKLLLASTTISLEDAFNIVTGIGGAFIPAHIERNSFSIISSLGFIPNNLNITTLEYHSIENLKKYLNSGIIKNNYNFIKSSDAHSLGDILERESCLTTDKRDISNIINKL